MLSNAQKATRMVGALETLVDINPQKLDEFVVILEEKSIYGGIVKLLTQDSTSQEVSFIAIV